jgi:hypothetical protein
LNSLVNILLDNPMTQFSFGWILSLNWLCQKWGQVQSDLLPSFGNIGIAPEAIAKFERLLSKWLAADGTPAVTRMAFGAVLVHPEQDKRQAYERLAAYLPVQLDPDSSDFSFQLNLPVLQSSTIEGLRINRLSKWNAATLHVVSITPSSEGVTRTDNKGNSMTRLELDINTVPVGNQELAQSMLPGLFNELARHGMELAEQGLKKS